MDRKSYKSKSQHVITNARTGEIERIIHPSDTDIGTSDINADIRVFGDSVVSGDSQIAGALAVTGSASIPDLRGPVAASLFGHRLSLSSTLSASPSDIASSTNLYLIKHTSNYLGLYDGTTWHVKSTSLVTKTLAGLTPDRNYDVFVYLSNEVIMLELVAWTSNLVRATALATKDGIYVKSGNATQRYVGTVRAVTATTIADTVLKRFVWNYYNRVSRELVIKPTTDSWTYATATWRAANNAAANSFEFVTGETIPVTAKVNTLASATTSGWGCSVGIGIDSTTVNSATIYGAITNANMYAQCMAEYLAVPAVGYHRFTWLEISGGITITYYGDVGNVGFFSFGMIGTLLG